LQNIKRDRYISLNRENCFKSISLFSIKGRSRLSYKASSCGTHHQTRVEKSY